MKPRYTQTIMRVPSPQTEAELVNFNFGEMKWVKMVTEDGTEVHIIGRPKAVFEATSYMEMGHATWQAAKEQYALDVTHPGKFENQPPWAPYFYTLDQDSGYDEWCIYASGAEGHFYVLDDEIRVLWPELKDVEVILTYEDDQGFYHVWPTTREEMEKTLKDLEESADA